MAHWNMINEDDVDLITKNRGQKFSTGFFTRIFWGQGGVSCYAATPLIVAFSPGHSDISRFRPCSPIASDRI